MENYACVTGADRGLGYDLAKELLENNYTVFAGRYMPDWPWLDELKQKYSNKLYLVDLDIGSSASVKAASDYIRTQTEYLDIIINNAAISGGADNKLTIFDELNFEKMEQLFNVNTLGPLRVTNALIDLLVKSETKLVVNISSEAGSIATCWRVGWFAYCMSKAALNMQSAIIHNNLKELGGQVLVIHPGHLQTWMSGRLNKKAETSPEESAAQIMEIINQRDKYKGAKPTYIDNRKKKWPW